MHEDMLMSFLSWCVDVYVGSVDDCLHFGCCRMWDQFVCGYVFWFSFSVGVYIYMCGCMYV